MFIDRAKENRKEKEREGKKDLKAKMLTVPDGRTCGQTDGGY